MRGRVLARDGNRLWVRADGKTVMISPAGHARPGDWVEIQTGLEPTVLVAYQGGDYPEELAEVTRLNEERVACLKARGEVLRQLRTFFYERDFLEIEPPTLVPSAGTDVHLCPISAGDGYLITSPEFAMKRLLVGGLERIYACCRCFRGDEEGAQHMREFTMVEWYRAWGDLDAIMDDTETLVSRCVESIRGEPVAMVSGRRINVSSPWPRITVAEACKQWAGFDLVGNESADALGKKVTAAGVDIGTATRWDDIFYQAFVERVEPALAALDRGVFLMDWPLPLAALARKKPDAPQWADRFEAYVGGIELANAFGELTCATEQRQRFVADCQVRSERGMKQYPMDERFLAALNEGMPPSAGIALGLDRLVMLATGATAIRQVSAFVADEL